MHDSKLKIRLIEPGNRPYHKSLLNYFVYNRYIRTPSTGVITLATILKAHYANTLAYSESISSIVWEDIWDADVVFVSIFTFSAPRGYEICDQIRKHSRATVVIGGLHATLNPKEASAHCDYVLLGEGDESILALCSCIEANAEPTFPGVAYLRDGVLVKTGDREPPRNLDVIPDRSLLYRFREMTRYNTIWPQVHASRGCPHHCDYCALVAAFGRSVRTRSPQNVVEDIRQAIDFFDTGHRRFAKMLWITDDNFFADREWAKSVLHAIIDSGITYTFTIQARYEVGFDDEMLELLKSAGFAELAMGIEFLEDEAFRKYHKNSTYGDILRAVQNVQRHGLRVRGLFIVGADNHEKGVGARLAEFVIQNGICGVLIQSMYFIPGTAVYQTHKDKLLHEDWDKCVGNVVHYPENISPYDLQKEIIVASRRIYSVRRLLGALFRLRGIDRLLFAGEFCWQCSVRADLRRELPYLKRLSEKS